MVTLTRGSHIFPSSLNDIQPGVSSAKDCPAATVWTILEQLGYEDVCAQLGGDAQGPWIHRLENVLTLDVAVHDRFDNMRLWFEEVRGEENRYRVVLAPGLTHTLVGVPEQVKFVARHGLSVPSPKYIRVHAMCCRVAHMSGAAKYLDVLIRNMEELQVLAEDGTSADVLMYALQGHRSREHP
ncbi:hypothetical protein DICSQDRAFT_106992 [Dichomitus squalens LYAD-421 SS1]|uniref:HNH nuclease domain-containing protein n=1 Tax=Dichomitus squalens (strain LYAD-421) TaxID=732165 RepID=R7SXJ1_DICSQ|nr:uncharacterized protein DICSQDRAFT_106992 [Dichomitus squalens LYAD-421 SS1]EJF60899.1 hypothetical protein DICSQDRAFT_106992 [Dichomitus squalens LYAD-421 SS1]